jgi:hypothetical protein
MVEKSSRIGRRIVLVNRSSSRRVENVSVLVVCSVPLSNLVVRNLDEPVRLGTIWETFQELANLVFAEFGQPDDVYEVDKSCDGETNGDRRQSARGGGRSEGYSHGKTDDAISGIEKADVSSVDSSLRRHPWKDEQVDVDGHSEREHRVPCNELSFRCAKGLSALSHRP